MSNNGGSEYQVRVVETVSVEKVYTIRAVSLEDAFMKAKMGETEKEEVIKTLGVVSRELMG